VKRWLVRAYAAYDEEMRIRTAWHDVRALITPVIARRVALVGGADLAQRILAPAMAWVLFERSVRTKVGVGLALSGVFTARTFVQRAFSARTEADLFQRTAAAVLEGDVLRAGPSSQDDARAEIVQAIFHAAQVVSRTLPYLVADCVACVVLGVWMMSVEPARFVALAAGLTVVAAATLLLSRRVVERALTHAWQVQTRAYEAFVDILDGRLEVVASGRRGAFLGQLRERTMAWGTAGTAVAGSSALAGRLPLLAIALLVAGAIAISPSIRQSIGATGATLGEVVLFASVTPAFAGVAQGLHGVATAERWLAVVGRIIRASEPSPHRARAPTDAPGGPTETGDVPSGPTETGDVLGEPIDGRFENVSFVYPGTMGDVLRDVTFSWHGRGALGLAGPNGSGKSTCLRLLLALAVPRSGVVIVGGVPLADVDPDGWRRRVAFMPQRPYLPPRSTVETAVRWLAPGADDARVLRALDRVGLLAALQRGGRDPIRVRVDTLSVGERQRVALARVLSRDAELFVLDEPDANLDRAGITLVADVLLELARARAVVFAAHTPELLDIGDHVVTLDNGRVASDSTVRSRYRPSASRSGIR
jgi:ABC-type multidrug transport system fused ATPase/permease subunit